MERYLTMHKRLRPRETFMCVVILTVSVFTTPTTGTYRGYRNLPSSIHLCISREHFFFSFKSGSLDVIQLSASNRQETWGWHYQSRMMARLFYILERT
jgi:hypothetical protein